VPRRSLLLVYAPVLLFPGGFGLSLDPRRGGGSPKPFTVAIKVSVSLCTRARVQGRLAAGTTPAPPTCIDCVTLDFTRL